MYVLVGSVGWHSHKLDCTYAYLLVGKLCIMIVWTRNTAMTGVVNLRMLRCSEVTPAPTNKMFDICDKSMSADLVRYMRISK